MHPVIAFDHGRLVVNPSLRQLVVTSVAVILVQEVGLSGLVGEGVKAVTQLADGFRDLLRGVRDFASAVRWAVEQVYRWCCLVVGLDFLRWARGLIERAARRHEVLLEKSGIMMPHRFYVVRGERGEWDEVFTLAAFPASQRRWLCRSTAADDPARMTLLDVDFEVGNFRMVAGVDRSRHLRPGVPEVADDQVNWMWDMVRNRKLEIDPVEAEGLTEEAMAVAALLEGQGPRQGAALVEVHPPRAVRPAAPVLAAPVLPIGSAAVPTEATALPAQPGGLGPPPVAGEGGASPSCLERLVQDMRVDLERLISEKAPKERKKAKRKHRRRRDSSSDSRSRSSPSSPSSSASSSSGRADKKKKKKKRKYFRWTPASARRKKIEAHDARNLEVLRFKRRPDLVQFHQEHAGALAAQFLCAVSQSLMRGVPADSKEMRSVDVVKWAQDLANLKELRDSREVATLAHVIQKINQDRLAEAMDVCAQRVKAICMAKAPKGSWEKASAVELIPMAGGGVWTQSEIALTGLGSA